MSSFNKLVLLVCGCFLFGCDDPCARKADRPRWCDEDGHGPPVCGDGVCANGGYYDNTEYCDECPEDCGKCHYCGDGECQSWDMLHAAPYVWESGTAEDCGNCAEDCLCDKWGFSCKVIGTYDDSWEGKKSECADDPWYEFKLAITGTYEDEIGQQFSVAPDEFDQIPGCSSRAFDVNGKQVWCFTEPSLSLCGEPTAPASTWFVCDMLAKNFGENMKQWCEALPPEQHCSDGNCGQLGVKITICGGSIWKISHEVE